ncbi:acyl-CoA dehydrogenase family protein, partial [Streptomyces sp. URMC 127]|uniref:acyl-CoA dehydrogenase family protein n=1 Tax=Streptomyces sp. URMC 127 TaxID=3423402 RepID=UPI003F19487E
AGQVLDGHSAGLLVVAARAGGYARGRTLLFVLWPGDVRGVRRTRLTTLDETRPQARVELRDAQAVLLGEADGDVNGGPDSGVPQALARLGAGVAALLAAEAVGAADRALERTVEHVQAREQFGRPIGSFQAVKHRLADLYVSLQAARSAAYYAAWAAGAGPAAPDGGPRPSGGDPGDAGDAGVALAQALETLQAVAAEAVQLHGGIGVTWEHDVQLYFKRAASDALLFGPPERLRARAAELAGLFAGRADREAVAP